MTRAFECAMCLAFCHLTLDDDGCDVPHACPWGGGLNAPKWQECEP